MRRCPMSTHTVAVTASAVALTVLGVLAVRPNVGPEFAVAGAGPSDLSPYLRFIGEGSVRVTPDTATISVSTNGRGGSKTAALDASSEKMNAVLAMLNGRTDPTIAPADIQSQGVSTYRDEKGAQPFRASNSLQITLHVPTTASELVVALNDAGADSISGPSFSLTDRAPHCATPSHWPSTTRAAKRTRQWRRWGARSPPSCRSARSSTPPTSRRSRRRGEDVQAPPTSPRQPPREPSRCGHA